MSRMIGIDLGTTNSVVATVDIGGTRVLQNRENEHLTRSVVGVYKENWLVGTPALRRWSLSPRDTVISVKRLMGRAVTDPEVEKVRQWALYEITAPADGTKDSVRVRLAGKEYSPVEISARILAKMKADAEFVLGEPVTHAVITVPAYFSDKQRAATREAGLQAGLTVMKILDEPTAAAIAYGIDSREQEARTILVFDLGGGTFDISVLMMAAGAFVPLNLEGDMWLGGDNFDQVIVEHVVQEVQRDHGVDPRANHRFMATLKTEAQRAKETLSAAAAAEIIVPGVLSDAAGNLIDVQTEITREMFDARIQPLLQRIVQLVDKAVENANFSRADIDSVLMVGNSSAIPAVQRTMEELFGKEKILRRIHPKHCVAMGAAMAAAVYGAVSCPTCGAGNDLQAVRCEKCGADLHARGNGKFCPACGKANDPEVSACVACSSPFIQPESIKGGIAPFHYGIQTAGDRFHIFIRKGDPFETPPEKRVVQVFYTRFPGQRIISVPVFGGDNGDTASANEKQGEAFAVLPPDYPTDTPVKVKLWLDRDGAFMVDTFLDDGTNPAVIILRGDIDQKAVDTLGQAEALFAARKDGLPPESRREIEARRNRVFAMVEKKDFAAAAAEAERLLADINAGADGGGVKAHETMIQVTTFIVNEYAWLLGTNAIGLQRLAVALQEAVASGNGSAMTKANENLTNELNRLLQGTALGIFLGVQGAINSIVQVVDARLAVKLREEWKAIEMALRQGRSEAEGRLKQFLVDFDRIVGDCQKRVPGGIVCPNCGHHQNEGRRCQKCSADLWILGSR